MKKITLLCFVLIMPFCAFAQSLPLDFEDPEDNFSAFNGAATSIVVDPEDDSNMVLQLIGDGSNDDGASIVLDTYVDLSDDSNNTITLDIWAPDADTRTHLIKLEGSSTTIAQQTFQTNMMGYQTVEIDFPAGLDNDYPVIVIFPDFDSSDIGTYYIDDIDGTNGETVPVTSITPPSTPAPTPPVRPVDDVASFFSNAYTPIAANLPAEPFSAAVDLQVVQYEGTSDDVFYLSAPAGGGFQFNFFSIGSAANLAGFTHFHMDLWVQNTLAGGEVFTAQALNYDGSDGLESNNFYQAPLTVTDEWISVDVELSDFINAEGNTNYDNLKLLQMIMQGPEYGPLFIDNVYFHKNTLGNDEFSQNEFVSYPNPTNSVWTIESRNTSITVIKIYNTLGKLVNEVIVNDTDAKIDASNLASGVYFAKVQSEGNKVSTLKLVKK